VSVRLSDIQGATRPGRRASDKPGLGVADLQGAMLHEAAEAVKVRWHNERGDALDAAEGLQLLDSITHAAVEAAHGEAPAHGGPAASVLGRRLLELLRAEVVRGWRAAKQPPEPELVLSLLEALEAVREAIEPDWSEYFTSRLSGPDGLDLVVEVAHDLRSPLTSVLFLAETIGRGQSGEVNELQRRQLRLIYSAALGLSTLASDVIELARGGDQLVEKEPSPFSVAEILESLHDMVRPIAEEKGLTIRYTVPPSDRRLGRPLAISRVLLNLTTNALKFTDEGYVEITTHATGRNNIEFAVRDTGHGITQEALANLYQPFRRSRGRTGRSGYYFSGTGLGLAMCRKLIEAMGSELKYESRPDWGTRFSFELNLPPESHL
jgi:signal transduction histidine kinase